jgi:hypothetical protein
MSHSKKGKGGTEIRFPDVRVARSTLACPWSAYKYIWLKVVHLKNILFIQSPNTVNNIVAIKLDYLYNMHCKQLQSR